MRFSPFSLTLCGLLSATLQAAPGQFPPGVPAEIVSATPAGLFASSIDLNQDKFGLYRSLDSGSTWTELNQGLPNLRILAIKANATQQFAAISDRVYRSSNNGDTWDSIFTVPDHSTIKALDVSGSTILAATLGEGVFRSLDNGNHWSEANKGLSILEVNSILATTMGATPYWFAGTLDGGVFRSSDTGSTWSACNIGTEPAEMSTLISQGSVLIAGTFFEGIFRSVDNGNSWVVANNGLPSTPEAQWIHSFSATPGDLFAGTDAGVYRSIDQGQSWTLFDDKVPQTFSVQILGTYLISASVDGISKSSFLPTNRPSAIGSSFAPRSRQNLTFLPLNSSLEYSTHEPGLVSVVLLDLNGRKLRTLFHGEQTSGFHRVELNLQGTPKGAYLLQLQSPGTNQALKIAVQR